MRAWLSADKIKGWLDLLPKTAANVGGNGFW